MLLALALAAFLSHMDCAAGNGVVGGTTTAQPNQVSNERADGMRIRIKVEDKVITATLIDNVTTRDFVSLLTLTLTLTDYAANEKISDLPRRLSTEGAPPGSAPVVGDITYYAPWGNLAVFHKDFEYSNGLVKLGTLDSGVEALSRPGPLKGTIELVK